MTGVSVENQPTASIEQPRTLRFAALLVMAACLAAMVASYASGAYASLPQGAVAFMVLWLLLGIVAFGLLPRLSFAVGFLVSLLCLLVSWRIAALQGIDLVIYGLLVAFLIYLAMFGLVAWRNIKQEDPALKLGRMAWHLTLIRIYIGFDLVPHFTEKLFAGPGPRDEDIKAFIGLGVPAPEFFVTLAGFCELGIAIGIGLGLLTRLAAVCSAAYFMIATILGHHFFLGFIWASPGGGWEYPVLMMVLLISFVIGGAGQFSVDNVILRRLTPPAWVRRLMVPAPD